MAKEQTFEHPPRGHMALLGYDPVNDRFQVVYVGDDGRFHVDVEGSALPSGAATETTLQAIRDRIGALTSPAAGSANKQLADLLTELQTKLETASLNIEAGSKDLQVDVKSTANPTNLDIAISALRDALAGASPNTSTLYALAILLTEIQARLGDETSPAAGSVNRQLADILTELQTKLETADLNLDGTKDLQVDVKTMPTVTVQAAGGDKLLSFESIVEEALADTAVAAAYDELSGTPVPSGKIWRITQVQIMYLGTVPTKIAMLVNGLAGSLVLLEQTSPTSGRWYIWTGELYMQVGDYVQAYVVGSTAGDDFYCYYAGVQMSAP